MPRLMRSQVSNIIIEVIFNAMPHLLSVLTILLRTLATRGRQAIPPCHSLTDRICYRSKQTLILSTPAGAVGIVTVLFCGWYSDRFVRFLYSGEDMVFINRCAE